MLNFELSSLPSESVFDEQYSFNREFFEVSLIKRNIHFQIIWYLVGIIVWWLVKGIIDRAVQVVLDSKTGRGWQWREERERTEKQKEWLGDRWRTSGQERKEKGTGSIHGHHVKNRERRRGKTLGQAQTDLGNKKFFPFFFPFFAFRQNTTTPLTQRQSRSSLFA